MLRLIRQTPEEKTAVIERLNCIEPLTPLELLVLQALVDDDRFVISNDGDVNNVTNILQQN